MYTGDDIKKAQQDRKDNILKGFDVEIEKGKSGVYEDNAENRKLGRVGKQYGSSGSKDESKQPSSQSIDNSIEQRVKRLKFAISHGEYKNTTNAQLEDRVKNPSKYPKGSSEKAQQELNRRSNLASLQKKLDEKK